MAIDIGNAASDRGSSAPANFTWLVADNPANLTGVLTSVEVWAGSDITGFKVGTFFILPSGQYQCRDVETIGAVTSGSKQTFSVTLNVAKGDVIGCYFSTGTIDREDAGGNSLVSSSGVDAAVVGVSEAYSGGTRLLSLYATGDGGSDTDPIDVGTIPTNRAGTAPAGNTYVYLDNPANNAGHLTSIELWAASNLTGCKVGTFYLVSGTIYHCRDAEAIGSVTAGSKQTFTVDLVVEVGDFIGIYYATGTLERTDTGGAGAYFIASDQVVIGSEQSYALTAGRILSLLGLGIEIAVVTGWSHKIYGGVVGKYNSTPKANIGKLLGIA